MINNLSLREALLLKKQKKEILLFILNEEEHLLYLSSILDSQSLHDTFRHDAFVLSRLYHKLETEF